MPAEKVSGMPLRAVLNFGCEPSDFGVKVAGAVVLIRNGVCDSAAKSVLAKKAGALGVLSSDDNAQTAILDSAAVEILRKLPYGAFLPTAGISQVTGDALLASLEAGKNMLADLSIDLVSELRKTHNIIAETRAGNRDTVVSLGSHTDSVEAGPGINDDGSGAVALLTVAHALASSKAHISNAVRFSWWSAEETGMNGSTHYVDSLSPTERAKIRLSLNFDMLASPNHIYAVYDGDGSSQKPKTHKFLNSLAAFGAILNGYSAGSAAMKGEINKHLAVCNTRSITDLLEGLDGTIDVVHTDFTPNARLYNGSSVYPFARAKAQALFEDSIRCLGLDSKKLGVDDLFHVGPLHNLPKWQWRDRSIIQGLLHDTWTSIHYSWL